MSLQLWDLQHHVIPGSHVRGAPRAIRIEEAPYVKLSVNQYTPKGTSRKTSQDALTIVLLHGIGMGKETFEPFLDDLLTHGATPIRSVWLPDSAFTGKSYLENKDQIGDVIHSHDYARDVLHMINYFQKDMPPPLVGMAFSYGCGALSLISGFHPRLFNGIVFLEPGIGPKPSVEGAWTNRPKIFPGVLVTNRKDTFISPDHARKSLRRSPYYKFFDERVMDKVMEHEFRPLTNAERAAKSDPKIRDSTEAVTLTTPKHLEAYQWLTPDPPLKGRPPIIEQSLSGVPGAASGYGFFHPFSIAIIRNLQYISAPMLIVWAQNSIINRESSRNFLLDQIGTGPAGNGGVATGKVEQAWVQDATHPIPLEKPTETAKAVLPWLFKLKESLDAARDARKTEPPFLDDFPQEWKDRISKI